MKRDLKIACISWINDKPNPIWTTVDTKIYDPEWIPKTYVGLAATSNAAPPDPLGDIKAFQKKQEFRGLSYCHLTVDIDEATQTVTDVTLEQSLLDAGWTPPFNMTKFPSTIPASILDPTLSNPSYYAGEYSDLSEVEMEKRHGNTTIKNVPADETVLMNAMLKFRAGSHTDNIGIKNVGSPFHVPWVWSEMVLTYAKGVFKMYGRGSIFPCHAWYFNGKRVQFSAQAADSSFPTMSKPLIMPTWSIPLLPLLSVGDILTSVSNKIDKTALKIYPVLSKGAPATSPQSPLNADKGLTTAMDTHPYTAGGIKEWSKIVS